MSNVTDTINDTGRYGVKERDIFEKLTTQWRGTAVKVNTGNDDYYLGFILSFDRRDDGVIGFTIRKADRSLGFERSMKNIEVLPCQARH